MTQTGLFRDLAFSGSAVDASGLPDSRAEVAIAGRSNAGKSSAINALARRRRLAFVSKTPGRTQQINFFGLGDGRYLVDLPGYGYAKVPRGLRNEWKDFISEYLQSRPQLRGLVVVMDVRHPMKDLDRQLLAWFAATGKPAHVLLTKADKLGRQAAEQQLRDAARALASEYPGVSAQLFSSHVASGIDEAEAVLQRWYGQERATCGR
ncbi:MAG TPA: ribosome biogenesis GTP-binding protein YihA/YsxC [Burkholderiales bacterium]|nr:ribosome biogenesis GTP-binding protein YihA/YsxC [Burkholderiales bacterium]